MTYTAPYLSFGGKCREAMEFYKQCIGGDLDLLPVAGSPAEQHCPPSMKDSIMHSMLKKDGFVLMATDMTSPEGLVKGNNMSISVMCSSEEEINTYFNALSEGGKVIDPLKVQFWGGIFGVLDDKYGFRWMFNFSKDGQ